MKKLVLVLALALMALVISCGGGGGGGDDGPNYQYLYDMNASYNSGFTFRWTKSTIRVAVRGMDPNIVAAALQRWVGSLEGVRFSVYSGSSGDIVVSFGSISGCGLSQVYFRDGSIIKNYVWIHPSYANFCNGLSLLTILTHELGHSLGHIGHSDAIMADGASNVRDEITGRQHWFFRELYSLAPLTYVPGLMKGRELGKRPEPPKGMRVLTISSRCNKKQKDFCYSDEKRLMIP